MADRIANLSQSERKYVCYQCRKPIVNMSMIARLRSKQSVQIHLYVLRDRLGALSTRLTLHGLRGQNLHQKPRCMYSHNVVSVQMTLHDLFTVLSLTG